MTVFVASKTVSAFPNKRLLPAGEASQEEGLRAHHNKPRRCECSSWWPPLFATIRPLLLSKHKHTHQLNIEVHCDIVPQTGENFIGLCSKGYERPCVGRSSACVFMRLDITFYMAYCVVLLSFYRHFSSTSRMLFTVVFVPV